MNIPTAIWTVLISAAISAAGATFAIFRWRQEFKQNLQRVHEEVAKQLVDLAKVNLWR